MKTLETIDFKIWGNVVPNKQNSSIKAYFNKELVFDQKIYKDTFKIEFSKICSFQKHQLIIFPLDFSYFVIKGLSLNRAIIDDLYSNLIDYEVSPKTQAHKFEFESPYAYYLLDRISD